MSYADGKLRCDMRHECTRPVTHIEEKGYIYCTECAAKRRGERRCRKLRAWELALLHEGKPVPSYEPISQAEAQRREACKEALREGAMFQLSGGKVMTYVGRATGGTFEGYLRFVDADAADGEGIPMYLSDRHYAEIFGRSLMSWCPNDDSGVRCDCGHCERKRN